mmetsp:Transcript_11213/g.17334  ORF Transcript_11213/g.17334 Transcript_11213/m.17334 type:complete len:160 (-) Transcript_11213:155-634(-)
MKSSLAVNALMNLLLVVANIWFCRAYSDWRIPTNSTVCTETEGLGIDQCTSAGDSFFFDQEKAKRCPQTSKTIANWTCDDWKCHVYCTNPTRTEERKSCQTCAAVNVSDNCWDERRERCLAFKDTTVEDCDVDCSGVGIHFISTLCLLFVAFSMFAPVS